MYYGLTSGQHLSKQKMQLYTVVKVGDGMDQGPATEVTHRAVVP